MIKLFVSEMGSTCGVSLVNPAVQCRYIIFTYNIETRDAPDTVFAGYPANPKAGYRISGRIFVLTTTYTFGKIPVPFIVTGTR
jgi:hypothetical protein